ncbi:MAG: SDR family oxidoreductase [Phreatobacter sp.]|uniref:SDR family oxidoreductase n=1 Tax=Phreatobacter sp. TaxID=1966341 RepID=UPI0040372B30
MRTIAVTGATGFIASHTIALLLEAGHHVCGTVRSLARPDAHAFLTGLPGAAERLTLVEADLLAPSSFDAAVAGCDTVLHMASPYVMTVADAQRDLVDPAVQGTLNVLRACARAPSVRRVVVTSSMAAVTDEPDKSVLLTEANWNTTSSLTRNPYYFSKAEAERAAWSFVEGEKPAFDLVTINPFVVIGPSLTPQLNTSNAIIADLLSGKYPGIIDLTWGMVDVRDVALAHVRAAETPGASGRYLCAGDTVTMREVVGILRGLDVPGQRLPSLGMDNAVGSLLVRLMSYTQPGGVGSYLRSHVGRAPRYDTTKIRRDLGLSFRDIRQSIVDTVADMTRWGHVGR